MTGEIQTPFRFVGEHLALDFVNTAVLERDHASDAIPDFRSALAWFEAAGTITARDARVLRAAADSREAARATNLLHAFRDDLRAMLDAYRKTGSVSERALRAINERLEFCSCPREIVRDGGGFALQVQYRFERPADLLMPLANAAAALLTEIDLSRVKRCRGECCDMYFLDTSRNRTRTWCEMASCGNRAKAAAYYERHSRQKSPSPQ
jgi:predicted RNA-binding Zn ribbon-like protein